MSSSNRGTPSVLVRMLALLASLTFIAAACGGGGDSDESGSGQGIQENEQQDEGEPKAGGTITVGLEAESQGWRPCLDSNGSTPGEIVMNSIYDSYVMLDNEGEYKPYLAESLEPNADFTEWTMKLRSGVKFHDGTPLDAQSVKDNFDQFVKNPKSNCASQARPIKSVEIVDAQTVKYVMNRPYAPFPSVLSTSVGRPFSIPAATSLGDKAASQPVGTGPFKFKNWVRDSQLEVVKNEAYWQKGLPYLDGITFKPIPDEQTRLAAVQSGDVDVMHSLRQEIVRDARNLGDAFERHEYIGNNSGGSIINTKVPPVDDKRVRQALAYSLNQEELIAVLGGEGISPPATQFFSKDSPYYSEKVAKGWPQNNPAKAKELLTAYMNDPNRSDKKPVGAPVEVTFNCPPDPSLLEVAQAYQAQTQAVGFKMTLRQFEQAAHIQNALKDDYMINCWRLGGEGDPDAVLYPAYTSPEGNPLNFTNFTSPEVQALLDKARETDDLEERKKAYEELHLIFNDEVPHLWTGNTATVVVTRPAVNGVQGWKFPNGDKGDGAPLGELRPVAMWLGE